MRLRSYTGFVSKKPLGIPTETIPVETTIRFLIAEDMSGPGRRNPNMKKGTRRPPQPPAPDNYKVQFDPHFMQQQHVPLQNPRNAYPYNFRHLQANAPGTQYDKANAAENRPYMNSRPNTTFDSPEPHHVQIGQYGAPDFQGSYHNPYNIGLGIQYVSAISLLR